MTEHAEDDIDWVLLRCRACRGKVRIGAAAQSQTLRCPHCGATIRLRAEREGPATTSARQGSPGRPAAAPAAAAAYEARLPDEIAAIEQPDADPIEDLELRRKPLPMPRWPLWSGVYSFPWHASGLRAWFLFGMGLSLVALLGGGLHYVIDLYRSTPPGVSSIWFRVFILYLKAFVLFVLWTGTYAGGFFLATLEETAAGSSKVRWPDESIWEGLFRFLGVAWLFGCAAVPLGCAAALVPDLLEGGLIYWSLVPSTVLLFPIVLLSALANDTWWWVWNKDVVVNLLVRPRVLLTFYLMSALLLCPCIGLGYLTIMEYGQFLFLAPLTGYVWSGCLLIYGRLLGRVAWIITGEHERAERAARRRRRRR
jgi:hypothetical protein